MDQKSLFMKIWDREAAATRKVLSRIPEGSEYRPDPKARTAREIAWLIVSEEIALADGLNRGTLEWKEVAPPSTMKEVLATYDKHHDQLSQKLRALEPARWERSVPFVVA